MLSLVVLALCYTAYQQYRATLNLRQIIDDIDDDVLYLHEKLQRPGSAE